MSSIVLSASVRQNLLSLQSTASLLATTQNDLATGNKVNSALDNPTSFFTASALNNRASDISNLLDGIGNGVQVLQAPIGYTAKSSVSAQAITGATASDLLGGSPATNAVLTGASAITTISLADTPATNAVAAAGAALTSINLNDTPAGHATETGTNTIATSGSGIDATGGLSFDINGHTVTLTAGGGTGTTGTHPAR